MTDNTEPDSKVIAQAVLYALQLLETEDRDKQQEVVNSILAHDDDQMWKMTLLAQCTLFHEVRRIIAK
jgi:hypothetical protein